MKGTSIAVILVGHGSKMPGFERAMKQAARSLSKRLRSQKVLPAFLEINRPSIREAVDQCVLSGAVVVKVLPYFLLTGRHVKEDIPTIVREARAHYRKKAKIILCPYLGFDPQIVNVLLKRLGEAV